MVHKIALNGYGRIGRSVLTAGSYSLNYSDSVAVCQKNSNVPVLQISDLKNILKFKDAKSLTDIYKEVSRKYNPDKDILINKNL